MNHGCTFAAFAAFIAAGLPITGQAQATQVEAQVDAPEGLFGKPDPEKLKAFNEANPETLIQGASLAKAPIPASDASVNYWSTNAFELINAKHESQFGRWQFVSERGTVGLIEEEIKTLPDDFLAGELRQPDACDRTTFIPLAPPTGIEPSADPVLLARPAPYAVSVGRRLAEGAK